MERENYIVIILYFIYLLSIIATILGVLPPFILFIYSIEFIAYFLIDGVFSKDTHLTKVGYIYLTISIIVAIVSAIHICKII